MEQTTSCYLLGLLVCLVIVLGLHLMPAVIEKYEIQQLMQETNQTEEEIRIEQAEIRRSSNLQEQQRGYAFPQPENKDIVRRVTVIDQNDTIFFMEGVISIDPRKNEINIIQRDEHGNYQKHSVRITKTTTYSIEELP